MKERIEGIKAGYLDKIRSASDVKTLEDLRVHVLGRSGELTEVLKSLGTLPQEERPAMGALANQAKNYIIEMIDKKRAELGLLQQNKLEQSGRLDVTLPGRRPATGTTHPVSQIQSEIVRIFRKAGFSVVLGPEIETDYYNFEALNMPAAHPARDMQDTFYLANDRLLRTHTSAVQVRTMERMKPPVAVIATGKVYRRDSDMSHIPMFQQVEGFLVDKKTNFANLKGVLTFLLNELFGTDLKVRFRPSYFPYTEPSAEVDVQCVSCRGKGCQTCKHTGWIEILGSGMVHPAVFHAVKYDPEIYQGFAFGIGVERVAMLKYQVNDIRLFYENDIRFLDEFKN
jgi:phenylalanyl-tRNA synthetase alpha chain